MEEPPQETPTEEAAPAIKDLVQKKNGHQMSGKSRTKASQLSTRAKLGGGAHATEKAKACTSRTSQRIMIRGQQPKRSAPKTETKRTNDS